METRIRLLEGLRRHSLEREATGMRRRLGTSWGGAFSSNDYLGYAGDPELHRRLRTALEGGMPAGSTGSRLLSGGHPVFAELEGEFASATGADGALFFGSASEANRAAVTTLVGRHDHVVLDELAHASLWDGALRSGARRDKFRHNDPEDLRRVLRALPTSRIRLVLTESVYSMDGDAAPLADLLAVCDEEDALLLVDEAHACGIYGQARSGLSEGLSRSGALVATTHGCGKALASAGGVLCAPAEVLDELVNTCREFIFTTAPSPLAACAALEALRLSRAQPERRERLFALAKRLETGLRELGFLLPSRVLATAILPVLCGGLKRALRLENSLSEAGYSMRAIRAPTVAAGSERVRLTLRATQDEAEIDALLAVLRASR
jgi:8-amino-7-oxononanoate synthase